jgi:hypothetical protein
MEKFAVGRLLFTLIGLCMFAAPSSADGPLQFFTITPCRLVDTRNVGGGQPPLAHDTTRDFTVQGVCGVPASARAVSLNVTVVQPSSGVGYLTIFPAGVTRPTASTINWDGGESAVANGAILGLSASGQLSIYTFFNNGAGNSTDLVLDVNGYFELVPANGQ